MTDQTPMIQGDGGPVEAQPVMLVSPSGVPYATPNLTNASEDVFVAYTRSSVTATGHAILVDASDIVNFPHALTGGIVSSGVYLSVDRDANAVGSVYVGVIVAINGTSATVDYLQAISFLKSDARSLYRDRRYAPSELSFKVSDGALVGSLTGLEVSGITAINTATLMDSPLGEATVTPAVGDVVVTFNRSAGDYAFTAAMHYRGVVA